MSNDLHDNTALKHKMNWWNQLPTFSTSKNHTKILRFFRVKEWKLNDDEKTSIFLLIASKRSVDDDENAQIAFLLIFHIYTNDGWGGVVLEWVAEKRKEKREGE